MYSLSTIDGEFVDFFDTSEDAMMHAITVGLAAGFRIDSAFKE